MGDLQAAIVGCGNLGRTHAQHISAVPGLTAKAFCDINLDNAKQLSDEYGGRYATDRVADVLADDSIEAVYVATQHDSHTDICVQALAAGKHVMVEKPLAMTVADCLRIKEAAEQASSILMVAFKLRYFDMVLKARELIPQPLMVSMQLMDNRWGDDIWPNDPVRGGGNVLGQGCHATDLLRFLAQRDPIEVFASGANYYQPSGVIDNLAAVFRFPDEISGAWIQGDADTPPHTSKFFAQLFDEGRSVTLSDRLTTLTYHVLGEDPVVYRGTESGFREESVDFVRAIREEVAAPIDVNDGLFSTVMALQAMASTASHRPEPVAAIVLGDAKPDGPPADGSPRTHAGEIR